MNKLITASCVVLVATAAFAMPNKQELAKAKPAVEAMTRDDLADYKAGRKTAQVVAMSHIIQAQKTSDPAEKYLLCQGAFKLYARCGEFDLAADAIQIMKRDVKDIPPEVIAEIVGEELRYVADGKAPRLVAMLKEDKNKQAIKWNYEIKDGAVFLRGPALPSSIKGELAIPESIEGVPVCGIVKDAFRGCGNVQKLFIPKSVKDIGVSPTASCGGLISISVDPGNSAYCSNGGVLLTKDGMNLIAGVNGNVKIPTGVKNIARGAFCEYGGLTSVTIPEGVTNIGYCAFCCTGLKALKIPSSVKSIEQGAFWGINGLESVEIPAGVKHLAGGVFWRCNGLKKVTMLGERPDAKGVFDECPNLKVIHVPANAKSWAGMKEWQGKKLVFDAKADAGATASDVKLNYDVRGDGVVIGGAWKLAVPTNTTGALVIPETINGKPVREIGMGAFAGCRGITSVTIPSGVKTISAHAFRGCTGLESVVIPEGVTMINAQAFDGCRALKSLTLPQSLEDLRAYSFRDCKALTSVTIPAGVANVREGAFDGCTGLKTVAIQSGVKDIGPFVFRNCSGVKKLEIPEGVESIGNGSFDECRSLTSLTIPSTVTNVWGLPFGGCNALKSVHVAEGNQRYKCENGLLLTKDGTELVRGFNVSGDVKIPEGVTSIRHGAFGHWVRSVAFPSTLKDIGSWTFPYCEGIKSLAIPEGVTNIGHGAFFNAGIKSLSIPSSVQSISGRAFARCDSLETVTISSGLTSVEPGAFGVCSVLKSFAVDSGNSCYSSRNGMLCSKDGSILVVGVNGDVKIPDGVKSIAADAFTGFNWLTALTIPPSVTTISKDALRHVDGYCNQLTLVTLLGERPDCPDGTFNHLPNLKEIHVPANAKSWAGMKEWQGKKLVFDAK